MSYTVLVVLYVRCTNKPYDIRTSGVEATGLGKRFGDLWALRDLDLDVPAGTVLGLLGHNGAGKTTAIRILTTLSRPTEGAPPWPATTSSREPAAVRARIGVAGQAGDGRRAAHRPREPRDGRPAVPPAAGAGARPRRRAARAPRPRRRRRPAGQDVLRRHAPPARPRRQPRRRARRSCSSTSRPPGWTRAAARTCGSCCASSCATAPRSSSRPSTSRRPTGWPTTSSCSTTAAPSPRARPAELKARVGGERVEVTRAPTPSCDARAAAVRRCASAPSDARRADGLVRHRPAPRRPG